MNNTAVLVVGHGSRLDYNKQLVKNFAEGISNEFDEVRFSFLSLNEPSLDDSLEDLIEKGEYERIVVFPFFLAKGIHTLKDIPEVLGLEEGEKIRKIERDGKEMKLIYSDPIGFDDNILDLGMKRIRESLREYE